MAFNHYANTVCHAIMAVSCSGYVPGMLVLGVRFRAGLMTGNSGMKK